MQNHLTITATAHRFLRNRERSQEFRNFLDLLWATGARPADLLALSAEHIDWGTKRLIFVPGKRKPSGPAGEPASIACTILPHNLGHFHPPGSENRQGRCSFAFPLEG